MNENSSEAYYFSLDSLSDKVLDYGNFYFIPLACVFSICTNLLNVIVLGQPNLKESLFRYMLLNSILDIFTFSLVFWLVLVKCGTLCSVGFSFGAKIYELYIYLYAQNVSQMYSNFMDLHITFKRLLVFSKTLKKFKEKYVSQRVKLVVIVLIGLTFPLTSLLTNKIVKIGSFMEEFDNSTTTESLYIVKSTQQSIYVKTFLIVLNIFVSLFFLGISMLVNSIMIYKFKKYIKGKKKLCRFKDLNRPSTGVYILILHGNL